MSSTNSPSSCSADVAGRWFDTLFRGTGGALGQAPDRPAVLEVAQVWSDAVLDVRHLEPGGPPLQVAGQGTAFVVPAEDLGPEPVDLGTSGPGGFTIGFRGAWRGFVDLPEQGRLSLSALCAQGRAEARAADAFAVTLPPGARAWIETGHTAFALRSVPPSQRTLPPLRERVDATTAGLVSFVGGVMALVLGVIGTSPPPVQDTFVEVPTRVAMVLMQPPAPPTPVLQPTPESPRSESGRKAKGEAGRSGDKASKRREAKGDRVRLRKREQDLAAAMDAGILGVLADDGAVAGMLASTALDAAAIGGLGGAIGAKGVRIGSGGLASRGTGLGGGMDAHGIGGLGTRGRSGGERDYGGEGGTWGTKQVGSIAVPSHEVLTLGGMDSSLIDQVVKRNMRSIRYCYQRALTRSPDLAGRLTVRFTIAADGAVSSAKAQKSSVGDAEVEQCVAGRFLRMQFPEVQGGGVVIVSYPFVFSPG